MDDDNEYTELLNSAYFGIKKVEGRNERFEIPKAEGRFEGKKTVITNFLHIVSYIRRDPIHFQKFLLKELASPGIIDGERLVLVKTVPSAKINPKIEEYIREFVLCKECGKPDTELVKQDRISFVNCLACGARHVVRSKI